MDINIETERKRITYRLSELPGGTFFYAMGSAYLKIGTQEETRDPLIRAFKQIKADYTYGNVPRFQNPQITILLSNGNIGILEDQLVELFEETSLTFTVKR